MDHSRVVDIMRRAGQLPLVKDYLLSVQKNNLSAVRGCLRRARSLGRAGDGGLRGQPPRRSGRRVRLGAGRLRTARVPAGLKPPSAPARPSLPTPAACLPSPPQVNEAVNELLIEEEDYAGLRDSITTYDTFDQLALAAR